jgi:uroporphyrinogen-III synthase
VSADDAEDTALTTPANSGSSDSGSIPLAGKRILVTRAPHQASELADRLRALGATPVLVPTIEIGAPGSFAALDAVLTALSEFDLTAFTSANAVKAFHRRAAELGIAATPRRVAVVGPATARALDKIGLHADVTPAVFTAQALGETLRPESPGRRILLVLAEDAPATLQAVLEQAGAQVTVAAAYRNRVPEASLAAVSSLFTAPSDYPDAVTFTSASTAANLAALLSAAGLALPEAVVRVSIGPITTRALRDLGLPPHLEAAESTIPALVSAIADYFRGEL